jgi:hypothetical protein
LGDRTLHLTSRKEIRGRGQIKPAILVTLENYAGIVLDRQLGRHH